MEIDSNPDDDPFGWFSDNQPPSEYGDTPPPRDGYPASDPAFLPEQTPADELDPSVDGFRQEILAEVKEGLEAAIEQLTNGYDQVYDGEVIGDLLLDMTQEAAMRGDVAEIDEYIGTMEELPDVYPGTLAEACFVGIGSGSIRADEVLRRRLAAEKAETLEELANMEGGEDPITGATLDSEHALLFELVRTCEEKDIAPDAWIDAYAVTPKHQWALYNDFYSVRMKGYAIQEAEGASYEKGSYDPGPHYANDQEHFDQIAADLAGNPDFGDDMVVSHALNMLLYTKDPAARERLVERYRQAVVDSNLPGMMVFEDLTMIGARVLEDPELAQGSAEYFKLVIGTAAEHLRDELGDEYFLEERQLEWRIAYARYHNAGAHEVVETLNQHTTRLFELAEQGPDVTVEERRHEVIDHRDKILYFCAAKAAENGDFNAAKTYTSAATETAKRELILQLVLGHATSVEQVATMRPDDMEAMLYPQLNAHIAFTEARLSDDPSLLTAFVQEHDDDDQDEELGKVEELVLEARRLLALRGTPYPEPAVESVSYARHPSLESVQVQYEMVLREERPSYRLRAMWQFAQHIPE